MKNKVIKNQHSRKINSHTQGFQLDKSYTQSTDI